MTEYITRLRAMSCFAVVILHTALAASGSFAPDGAEQLGTILLKNLMLWSVPCFIMVTGTLLLTPGRKIPYRKLFGKYIKRVLLCILVFTALYIIVDLILGSTTPGPELIRDYVYKVAAGKSWSHMWYLYMLLALYLMLPIYRIVAAHAEEQEIKYMLVVLFVFLSVLPMVRTIFQTEIAFFICVSAIYPFYLFAGYYMHAEKIRLSFQLCLILLAVSTAGLAALTAAAYSRQIEAIRNMLGAYSFPLTLIQSVCVFSLFKDKNVAMRENKVWKTIDTLSFGIYLTHMIFLKILYVGLGFNPYEHGGVLLLLPIAVCVFILSAAATFVLKKVWGFRKIL